MKRFSSLLAALFVAGSVAAAEGEPPAPGAAEKANHHKLISVDGSKVIEAEIILVGDRDVRIRMGGKDLDVPYEKFNPATQDYLKKWGAENVRYSFTMKRKPKKISDTDDEVKWGYEVTLESRAGLTLKDLIVKYQIYNTKNEIQEGEAKIDEIRARGEVKFNTEPGSLIRFGQLVSWEDADKPVKKQPVNQTGGRFGRGAPPVRKTRSNNLGGIWIRVYDSARRMVFEDRNLMLKTKPGSWRVEAPEKAKTSEE